MDTQREGCMTSPLKNSQDIKALKSRITKTRAEMDSAKIEMQMAQRRMSELQSMVSKMENELKAMEGSKVTVTEHAILRYLERVRGIDLEEVENTILPEAYREKLINGKIPINGFRIVVKDNTVITVEV